MENIKNFYRKYKLIIWPIIVGVSSIAILVLVIIPQLFAYLSTRTKINEIESKSTHLEVKAADLEQLDEESTRQNLEVVFSILPKDPDVPDAMLALHDVISRSGLILRNTTYRTVAKSDKKENFLLSVGVAGQMTSIRDFLIQLQESSRLFQLESITARFQRGMTLVEADLPIAVYFDTSAQMAGDFGQNVPKLTEKEEQLLAKLVRVVKQTAVAEDVSSVPYGKIDPFED